MTRLRLLVEDHRGVVVLHADERLDLLPPLEREQLTEELASVVRRLGSPVEADETMATLLDQLRRGYLENR